MTNAVIVDAIRTPLGRRNGKLKEWHPVDLAAETASTPEESKVVDRVTAELLDTSGGRDASPPLKAPTRTVGQLERADLDLPARA